MLVFSSTFFFFSRDLHNLYGHQDITCSKLHINSGDWINWNSTIVFKSMIWYIVKSNCRVAKCFFESILRIRIFLIFAYPDVFKKDTMDYISGVTSTDSICLTHQDAYTFLCAKNVIYYSSTCLGDCLLFVFYRVSYGREIGGKDCWALGWTACWLTCIDKKWVSTNKRSFWTYYWRTRRWSSTSESSAYCFVRVALLMKICASKNTL